MYVKAFFQNNFSDWLKVYYPYSGNPFLINLWSDAIRWLRGIPGVMGQLNKDRRLLRQVSDIYLSALRGLG